MRARHRQLRCFIPCHTPTCDLGHDWYARYILVIALLSHLVLLVACVNYTNLATAQSLGRTREVGMRKTMGATQTQLLTQFLVESLVIAAIAMVFAIAILEIIIPLFQ